MPKNRKYYQRKKLGLSRVDLPLNKKRQYLRKIITFGEAYKKVTADFRREFGKELPRSTFNTWKQTGQSILESESAGSSHRVNYKQSDEKTQFEEEVLRRIKASKVDIEGLRGTKLILEEVQAQEIYQQMPEIKKLQLSELYINRIIQKYNFSITKVR